VRVGGLDEWPLVSEDQWSWSCGFYPGSSQAGLETRHRRDVGGDARRLGGGLVGLVREIPEAASTNIGGTALQAWKGLLHRAQRAGSHHA
jgi:hypothetical protein